MKLATILILGLIVSLTFLSSCTKVGNTELVDAETFDGTVIDTEVAEQSTESLTDAQLEDEVLESIESELLSEDDFVEIGEMI